MDTRKIKYKVGYKQRYYTIAHLNDCALNLTNFSIIHLNSLL